MDEWWKESSNNFEGMWLPASMAVHFKKHARLSAITEVTHVTVHRKRFVKTNNILRGGA